MSEANSTPRTRAPANAVPAEAAPAAAPAAAETLAAESTTTAPVAASAPVAAAAPAADPAEELKAPQKWIVVAGTGPLPTAKADGVIVAENHPDPQVDDDGMLVKAADRNLTGYAAGATAYLRASHDVDFGEGARVVTLGESVQQAGIWGFSLRRKNLCVGPALPAWAAANYAVQQGATEVEIVGLTDRQKALVQPFVDALTSHPNKTLRSDVVVTLS